jgi:hypothetical protein
VEHFSNESERIGIFCCTILQLPRESLEDFL